MSRRRLLLALTILVVGCGWIRRERQSETAPPPIDLNHASRREIEALPGITPSMARRIVEARPYSQIEDLTERGLLTDRELDRIRDRIRIQP